MLWVYIQNQIKLPSLFRNDSCKGQSPLVCTRELNCVTLCRGLHIYPCYILSLWVKSLFLSFKTFEF